MSHGPIIDPDVHHTWASPRELFPYLPDEWREYVHAPGHGRIVPTEPAIMTYPHTWGTNKRLDSYADNGAPPGADYETMCKQLLDPLNVAAVVLSYDISTVQAGELKGKLPQGREPTVFVKLAPKSDGFYGAVSVHVDPVPVADKEVLIRGHVTNWRWC